jgi:hypothetical protein
MTATKIPVEGDNFAGQVFHVAYKLVTVAQMIPDTAVASTAAEVVYDLFAIDQPYTWVKEIGVQIVEAFGSSNTLVIGDTANDDGFLEISQVAATVIQTAAAPAFHSSVGVIDTAALDMGAYGNAGKIYTTTSVVIDATLQLGGGSAALDTVGQFQVYAVYTVLPATWPS